MPKKPTVPLKITATLTNGRIISADGIIMFDAILYHAWFCKNHPEVFITGKWRLHGAGFIGLPLRQLPGNRWAASRGIYTEIAQNIEQWGNTRQLIRIVDKTMEFYCMGNAAKIMELLTNMRGIGKETSMGWGAVEKWEAEEIEADYSLIHPVHGLMRPTPVEEIDEANLPAKYPVIKYAVKPPYWKQENERLCYVPLI